MGFAAIARVTEDRWVACSVLDEIDFARWIGRSAMKYRRAAKSGRHRQCRAEDPIYCKHATPAMYGFQNYISVPTILANGAFFGTLCAIDPHQAHLRHPKPRYVPAICETYRQASRRRAEAGAIGNATYSRASRRRGTRTVHGRASWLRMASRESGFLEAYRQASKLDGKTRIGLVRKRGMAKCPTGWVPATSDGS
jgi:hypothetical protein